jgi:hypothetical protein
MVVEEGAKPWITVEPRQTAPHDAGAGIQKSAKVTVADHGKFEDAQGCIACV